MMEGFLVKDTLTVLTQNGECHIQLCLGDITRLKRKDKVDVILISAFAGDYSPTPTSVIGALLRNLQINVRELARDKEEDLRKLYHCWWSKPLPASKPFNRLLCFETKVFGSQRPQELVGDVFRCLVPILNNQDGTVITPLLNTGDQGYGKVVMLRGMVEAAVNWMKAGLPLRMLKIVLYCRGKDDEDLLRVASGQFERVFKCFEELKERYMMKNLIPKEVTIKFDVYMSFSKYDTNVMRLITEKLQSNKKDIRIFDSNQRMDVDSVWQEDMYDVMMQSARVITVLTPNYLQCTSCIEQYNIAMCCSRKAMRNMLAPFYVEESTLPTYMTQVQYVDCRSCDQERIGDACHQIVLSLTVTLKPTPQINPSIQYDVFVSYSHADTERANHIVETLKRLNPDLRLFFDIQELKTGSAWQRTLYHSIDGSRVMLALISNKYLSSAVCQEEYNLALAKHCSESNQSPLKLVPLCIEDLHGIAPEFTMVKMVNAKRGHFSKAVDITCTAVVDWLAGREVDPHTKQLFEQDKDMAVDTDTVCENFRQAHFRTKYGTNKKLDVTYPTPLPKSVPERPQCGKDEDKASMYDVVFSYASEDTKYATHLAAVLGKVHGVTVRSEATSEHERLALFDQTQHVVAILSPHYIQSMEKSEEFNIALSRQRLSTRQILFPIHVHVLPQQPTYFHLVPTSISTADKFWLTNIEKAMVMLQSHHRSISEPTELALNEAAHQIIQEIKTQRTSPVPSSDEVRAAPTLLNIKKLQHQAEHGLSASADEVRQYLLTLTPDEADDTVAANTSNNDEPAGQPDPVNNEVKSSNAAQNVAQIEELDGTSSVQPDSSSLEQVQTSSQVDAQGVAESPVDVPAQSKQPDSTSSDRTSKGTSRNGSHESMQRSVSRVDESTGGRKLGSAACSVI